MFLRIDHHERDNPQNKPISVDEGLLLTSCLNIARRFLIMSFGRCPSLTIPFKFRAPSSTFAFLASEVPLARLPKCLPEVA